MSASGVAYWVRIAALFLVRSGRATAALSTMVVTAVAALIFLSALAVGVRDAMLRNTVGLFSGHITGTHLPASMSPQDLMVKGVDAVLKRVTLPGVLTGNGLSQPIVLYGIDPDKEAAHTALPRKIERGRFPERGRPEILISRGTAQTLGTAPGEVLHFGRGMDGNTVELTVSGVYQTGLDMLDRGLAFSPQNEWMGKDLDWSAAIFLKPGIDVGPVMAIYRTRFQEPVRFETWERQMPDLRQLIDLEAISMAIVIVLVFAVVAIGIACSFVIFIIRNLREYGVLKAMGVSTAEMSLLIVAKVVLMNAVACCAGLVIGVLAVGIAAHLGGIDIGAFTSHNRYFAVSGVIVPRLTAFSLWAPPAVSLGFSLMAAVWPAALVSRKKAADILRVI